MKVYLDTSSLQGESKYRGIGRYIEHLEEMKELSDVTMVTNGNHKNDFILTNNEKVDLKFKKVFKKCLPKFVLNQLKFLLLCKRYYNQHFHSSYKEIPMDSDIIHAPANYFPYSLRKHPAKKVVSVLDVIPLIEGGKYNNEGFEWFVKKSFETVKYADKVITISNHSKQDIIKYLNVPEDKIEVITLGFKPSFGLTEDIKTEIDFLEIEYKILGPYLLYVGALEERKNIKSLLLAFSKVKCKELILVIVGKENENSRLYKAYSKELGIEDRVCFTGYIHDTLLPLFYKNALAFIFPSYYEGFGLPVLEAMSLGVPVITSNVSSLPEVTGEGAILVDPYDVTSITKGIQRVVEMNSFERGNLIKKGFERVKDFSWEDTKVKTKELYFQLNTTR